jgi:diacylglycerol kinase family enzyme
MRQGFRAELIDDLGEMNRRARELWDRNELRAVVAAGGDGTVAAIANQTPAGTPLVVYPLGTENLIARYFGYALRPRLVVHLLRAGQELAIDAGQAGEKLFVLMISAGFDAEVVRQVAEGRAGHIRRWTYFKPLFSAMRTYRYPALRIGWRSPPAESVPPDSSPLEFVSARWVFGMNLSKYAFGLNFAPAATGTDGLLDVCTFSEGSVIHVFRYAWGVFSRRHLRYRDTRMIRCQELRIDAPEGVRVPYQLDGDFGGFLPVHVRILPGRLRFVVLPETAHRLALSRTASFA